MRQTENTNLPIANRISLIKPSPTLAVTEKAMQLKKEGKKIIGLGAGQPDFDTPDNIKEKAKQAIDAGKTKYTPAAGTEELKKAIQQKFANENGLQYELNEIMAGTGGKQVLFNAILALINPSDEVVIPAPYWVSYPEMVSFAEGIPVIVDGYEENNFKITPEQLDSAITSKTKLVFLNSPNNPTGAAYTEEELKDLTDVLLKYPNVWIISDDIYEHITYDGFKFKTVAQVEPRLKHRTLTVNGVSKAYSMTGWRIGYVGAPVSVIKAMSKLQSQSTSNPCSISQEAAVEALVGTQSFIQPNNDLFKRRRDLMIAGFNNIAGMKCLVPEGAFYVFPSCKAFLGKKTPKGEVIKTSTDFANYLLEDAQVAVVPGIAFGMEGYFRASYATSDEDIKNACEAIKKSCEKLS